MDLIHKYMNFQQFVGLVETQCSYLTQVDKWEDPYEKRTTLQHAVPPFFRGAVKGLELHALRQLYAQCWTTGGESDAMWRIYSDKFGVRISAEKSVVASAIDSTLVAMMPSGFKSHSNIDHFPVIYDEPFDPDSIVDGDKYSLDARKATQYKREAFSHEREYRFALRLLLDPAIVEAKIAGLQMKEAVDMKEAIMNQAKFPESLAYDFRNEQIVEVLLDPRAPRYFINTFIKYCEGRGFVGKGIKYRHSDLYRLELS
ncbi:DUF2971 domain-containing protein [Undibacterium sp.]|jgi:hypothetical protein|uniref:DUF2971 domain-containing protein n=1 Tax=Undibacterium sp. TaxID=1914977 RepID=UPI002C2DF4B3|nr:DUF2971 domain-containing protein [Undibacterium sp.]HTD06043.1 DUF2971 domain-containing protein [Undibacterium sp.]